MNNEQLNKQPASDIQLSAYFDGELSAVACAEIEVGLKTNDSLQLQLKNYQQLESATAALPVPDMLACRRSIKLSDLANQTTARDLQFEQRLASIAAQITVPEISNARYQNVWKQIDQRTADATQQRLWKKLDQATARLAVPVVSASRWTECFRGVADRTQLDLKDEVPQVSNGQWNSLWAGIEKQIATKKEKKETVLVSKTVRAEHEFAQHGHAHWHPWRWISASILAASVLVAVFISRIEPPQTDAQVAMEIPEVQDDRYYVCVQYVEAQSEPVMCFFLKKGRE